MSGFLIVDTRIVEEILTQSAQREEHRERREELNRLIVFSVFPSLRTLR